MAHCEGYAIFVVIYLGPMDRLDTTVDVEWLEDHALGILDVIQFIGLYRVRSVLGRDEYVGFEFGS